MDFKMLLRSAYTYASKSPDPSTQNGALLVDHNGTIVANGINKFTSGMVVRSEILERPLKYSYIEHAERNCIYSAASKGIKTHNKIMVCPWAACEDCARAIVQSGISILVRHKQASDRSPQRWLDSIAIAEEILRVSNVEIIDIDAPKLYANPIMHCEEKWTP